jgi:hypothetical protein
MSTKHEAYYYAIFPASVILYLFYLPTYVPNKLPTNQPTYLPTYLPAYLSIYLPIYYLFKLQMGFYPVGVNYNKTQHTNNTHHTK